MQFRCKCSQWLGVGKNWKYCPFCGKDNYKDFRALDAYQGRMESYRDAYGAALGNYLIYSSLSIMIFAVILFFVLMFMVGLGLEVACIPSFLSILVWGIFSAFYIRKKQDRLQSDLLNAFPEIYNRDYIKV